MALIAILHYTLAPEVGGVESLIRSQAEVLTRAGHTVRLIAGSGKPEPGQELVRVPQMLPSDPAVSVARTVSEQTCPNHPLVRSLARDLAHATSGCDVVCVHNLLTLNLNSYLTTALLELISRGEPERWSIWCEDFSIASRFTSETVEAPLASLKGSGVDLVTISEHRAREMCDLFGVRREDVRVVSPPVSTEWLRIEEAAMDDARALGALRADPFVLVPSKLAEHKGLNLCPPVAEELSKRFEGSRVLITGAASPHEPRASERVREHLRAESGGLKPGSLGVAAEILGREMDAQAVRAVMMLADVVFLPSLEEGYGLAMAEACALGTAVVCTDISPFREAGNGWATYVSTDASAEEIADAISGACCTPAARARRAAVRSFERFSAELADLWRAQLKV